MANDFMAARKNEIVVFQPDDALRLEVRVDQETAWLTQQKIGELFGVGKAAVSKHLKNIFETGELVPERTVSKMETVQVEGFRKIKRCIEYYNLDAIIAVGYRVNSIRATQFRIWATGILREYLLRGYAFNTRLNQLEDKVDRRLAKTEQDVIELKQKVDFFVQTNQPPVRGVFYDGQLWDACSLVERLIARAKKTILLIDSWVGPGTLDMLAKKRAGVSVEIVSSPRGNKLATTDIAKFNAQYPTFAVKTSRSFHDRFLVLDDSELYLIGASLKDLGVKCFAFTRLDGSEISTLKARI